MRTSAAAPRVNLQLNLDLNNLAGTWDKLLSSLRDEKPRQTVGNIGRLLFLIQRMRQADLLSFDEYSALKDRVVMKVFLEEEMHSNGGKDTQERERMARMSRPISSSREQRRRHYKDDAPASPSF
ncbi:Aste57867_22267 [Aphanomyces stellatus]|uniref:Aste57867_22267 protein n=1 Tax=Aphanomyces stellatus TaxID=120398 RepID=A0A485LLM6_9STRA|nr:hypothetical protein As57867_022197 [Aphanomyces stellatus]VFT98933.1 Aste57867_22267 [Aphanomyces stellatus]